MVYLRGLETRLDMPSRHHISFSGGERGGLGRAQQVTKNLVLRPLHLSLTFGDCPYADYTSKARERAAAATWDLLTLEHHSRTEKRVSERHSQSSGQFPSLYRISSSESPRRSGYTTASLMPNVNKSARILLTFSFGITIFTMREFASFRRRIRPSCAQPKTVKRLLCDAILFAMNGGSMAAGYSSGIWVRLSALNRV